MKKVFFLILILYTTWGCNESQPIETVIPPDVKEIIFSGNVISNGSNSAVSELIIKLRGANLLTDTTNTDGQFNFLLDSEGEYEISIDNILFQPFDTLLSISKDTSIVIKINPVKREHNFTGYVIDSFREAPIENAKVFLYGNKTYQKATNVDGFFSFKIDEGNYNLQINNENYVPFDSTLIISKDTSITINLSPILYDYFPLELGNKWTFEFNHKESWNGGYDKFEIRGEKTWEVIESEVLENNKSYLIEDRLSGTKYEYHDKINEVIRDTTIIEDDTSYFYIHEIFNEVRFDVSNSNGVVFHTEKMNRFNTSTVGDTLIIAPPFENKYLREVGLIEFYVWGGGNYSYGIRMQLLDFNNTIP